MRLIAFNSESHGWVKPENGLIPANFTALLFDSGAMFSTQGEAWRPNYCTVQKAFEIESAIKTEPEHVAADLKRQELERKAANIGQDALGTSGSVSDDKREAPIRVNDVPVEPKRDDLPMELKDPPDDNPGVEPAKERNDSPADKSPTDPPKPRDEKPNPTPVHSAPSRTDTLHKGKH